MRHATASVSDRGAAPRRLARPSSPRASRTWTVSPSCSGRGFAEHGRARRVPTDRVAASEDPQGTQRGELGGHRAEPRPRRRRVVSDGREQRPHRRGPGDCPSPRPAAPVPARRGARRRPAIGACAGAQVAPGVAWSDRTAHVGHVAGEVRDLAWARGPARFVSRWRARARGDARSSASTPRPRATAADRCRRHTSLRRAAHQLRGVGRRRGPQVGDEVGDREVGLVADAGDDGHARGHDGARDGLLVERPQVFDAAAASRDDDHVDVVDAQSASMARATSPAAPSPCTRVSRSRTRRRRHPREAAPSGRRARRRHRAT